MWCVFRATAQAPYEYRVTATDSEGQALEFLLPQPLAGMDLDATTGVLRWTPTPAQIGLNAVTVIARDAGGATAAQRFTIDVADNNRPPAITSTPVLTVRGKK